MKESSVFEWCKHLKEGRYRKTRTSEKVDIDSENFHNPLCSYRHRNIRAMTQKFDEEIAGQILVCSDFIIELSKHFITILKKKTVT